MIVDSNGGVWSWGHPEYGQLGHGTDGGFLEKAGKTTFHFVYSPEKIHSWVEKDPKSKGSTPCPGVVIKEISCGSNHTVVIGKIFYAKLTDCIHHIFSEYMGACFPIFLVYLETKHIKYCF